MYCFILFFDIFLFFRHYKLVVRQYAQRQRRPDLLHQHGEVREFDGGLPVPAPDGQLPRDASHRVERRQLGIGKGKYGCVFFQIAKSR